MAKTKKLVRPKRDQLLAPETNFLVHRLKLPKRYMRRSFQSCFGTGQCPAHGRPLRQFSGSPECESSGGTPPLRQHRITRDRKGPRSNPVSETQVAAG